MRWERLFEDLAAQLAEGELDELRAEVADRTRLEAARVRLADRLRASMGRPVVVRVLGAGRVRGQVGSVGADWVLVAEETGGEAVIPLAALIQLTGLGSRAQMPGEGNRVAGRLGLGYVLREISRDRSEVAVTLVDGGALRGTVDRVGADYVDLAERPGAGARLTVTFDGIGVVRRSA